MLIATGQLTLLADFLQLLCWIILPVLLLTFLVTVAHHYFRRKRNAAAADAGEDRGMLDSPEGKAAADYVLFDHSGLVRQYRNKLTYSHARYRALKQDYESLREKYDTISITENTQSPHSKKSKMENNQEQVQANLEKMTAIFADEKKNLLARLEELDRSCKNLEAENELLLQQANLQSSTEDEKQVIVNSWAEENKKLKDQLVEQLYLRDMVEEKKAQVDFLQTQLEQRIKKQHETERAREQVSAELETYRQMQQQFATEKEQWLGELSEKQQSLEALQHILTAKDNELTEKNRLIREKEDHLIYAESQLSELKQQNDLLHATVADSRELADALGLQLKEEESKRVAMEQKLQANKQLMQRLYKEFASCVEEDNKDSVVVSLRPAYLSSVAEEY